MTAKNRLIQLFNLPEDETIFEDFGCALVDNILRHGRMFVGENYICFYSTIMGITTKKVISVDKIINIEKKSMLGFIQSAIEIITEEHTYFFSSFSKRDLSYKLLYAVWKGEPFDQEEELEEQIDIDTSGIGEEQQVESAEVEILNLEENDKGNEKYEILKMIMPVSVDQFFDYFFSDNAGYTYEEHLKKNNGGTNIQMTQWNENDEGNAKTREINCVIKVKGVPFKDSSRMYKVHTYKKLDNNEGIEIRQMCKTLDVPYASNFQVEEHWTISPIEDQPQKCKLTISAQVIIIKNFVWASKAKSRGIEEVKENCNDWMELAKKFLQQLLKKQEKSKKGVQEYEKANIMDQNELIVNEKQFINEQNGEQKKQENFQFRKSLSSNNNSTSNNNVSDESQNTKNQIGGVSNKKIQQLQLVINVLLLMVFLLICLLLINLFYASKISGNLENRILSLENIVIENMQQYQGLITGQEDHLNIQDSGQLAGGVN